MSSTGVLLAGGAGRRFGGPKALVPGWLEHGVGVLRDGGCDRVLVVLGAEAEAARALVPAGVDVVVASDWDEGMGASLRAGLVALGRDDDAVDSAVVHLVDLPDVTAEVVARVLASGAGPDALARAAFAGTAGHPVLIGHTHWEGVVASATGDRGARQYLADHPPALVECGDLASGEDVDEPGANR